MLDIEEVAARLNIRESTIRRLVHAGALRAYRIGGKRGKLRFRPEDLDRYIESAVVQPKEENEGQAPDGR